VFYTFGRSSGDGSAVDDAFFHLAIRIWKNSPIRTWGQGPNTPACYFQMKFLSFDSCCRDFAGERPSRLHLTPFPTERDSANSWLTASFNAIIFSSNYTPMSRLGKNKARGFPVAFLVVFDMEFSFSSLWTSLPNLIAHHTISYIHLTKEWNASAVNLFLAGVMSIWRGGVRVYHAIKEWKNTIN